MNTRFILTGILLLTLCAPATMSAQAASSTLYTRIKQQVERETAGNTVDDDVVTFLRLTFQKRWALTDGQIRDVFKGNTGKACNDAAAKSILKQLTKCQEMGKTVKEAGIREQNVRSLGRRLTSLVGSYELPLSDLPDRTLHISSDLLGVLTIWSAGTGNILSTSDTPAIRSVTVDEATAGPVLQRVADELNKLSPEERTAAVWRLRSGVLLENGIHSPTFPAPTLPGGNTVGTERQYLNKHWNDLEMALANVVNTLINVRVNPPLTSKETAYIQFPQDLMKRIMPDNIVVWDRLDGDAKRNFMDAGLEWGVPLEPVFPSLKKDGADEAILGGNFPPEPVVTNNGVTTPWDGMQLCTNPLAMRGYLCRPYVSTKPGERCPVEVPADNDEISLVHCTVTSDQNRSVLQWCSTDKTNGGVCKPIDPIQCKKAGGSACGTLEECQKQWNCNPTPAPADPVWCCLKKSDNQCAVATSQAECVQRGGSPSADEKGCVLNGCEAPVAPDIRYTSAGADACRDIGWKNLETFDPNTQCKVSLTCANACTPGVDASAFTAPKAADGSISICVNQQAEMADTYLVYHELAHAYQKCNQPPGFDFYANQTREEKNATCCEVEGEAYRLQCAMMERDGVFKNRNGGDVVVDGVVINAQTCAETSTNFACGKQQGYDGCFVSHAYTQNVIDAVVRMGGQNPKNVPALCSDAIDPAKMDPRVTALKDEVEKRDDVCTPGTITGYQNRIGNNMCYIGQCAEQSIELHRITAGQSPSGVQSAVAPWQEPMSGTPLGNLLSNPPMTQYTFPPYRPQLLVHALDAALCESAGLPALLPPALCTTEALRQLSQTQTLGIQTAMGLIGQNNQQQTDLRDLMTLSRGIGVRAGTEMYGEYLHESSRAFAEIIGMASELLGQLKSIEFPTQMCPISPGMPPSLTPTAP